MRLIGFVILAAILTLAPLAAEAQQAGQAARIGYLAANLTVSPHMNEAFRQGLRDLGYVDGRSVVIEYRDAEGKYDRLPALAAELVALKVDVIVAADTPAALAAKQATRTLPIVFIGAGDPVADGLVTSFARGCPSSPRSSSASGWNCSSRPFRGSVGSPPSGSQVSSANARKKTC
jgi:putative tryptophan/tyrosine transport system substrate-binding protein